MAEEFVWQIEIHDDFRYAEFLASLLPDQALEVAFFLEAIRGYSDLSAAPRSWVKPLGSGLFEFRIQGHGLLVRVFFAYKKGKIILLLGAYNKGGDSSKKRQNQEISLAKKRLRNA